MSPDQWLGHLKADTIIAFFGFNSSFNGPAGLENFKGELGGFIKHTLKQQLQRQARPQAGHCHLPAPSKMSPTFTTHLTPRSANKNLGLYTEAMKEVCCRAWRSFH